MDGHHAQSTPLLKTDWHHFCPSPAAGEYLRTHPTPCWLSERQTFKVNGLPAENPTLQQGRVMQHWWLCHNVSAQSLRSFSSPNSNMDDQIHKEGCNSLARRHSKLKVTIQSRVPEIKQGSLSKNGIHNLAQTYSQSITIITKKVLLATEVGNIKFFFKCMISNLSISIKEGKNVIKRQMNYKYGLFKKIWQSCVSIRNCSIWKTIHVKSRMGRASYIRTDFYPKPDYLFCQQNTIYFFYERIQAECFLASIYDLLLNMVSISFCT